MRRYSDADIYAAAARHGDQTLAAQELGLSATWVGKRCRTYAQEHDLPVPRNPSGHAPVVVRVRPPDRWDHRRVTDGGLRVREQRRMVSWP